MTETNYLVNKPPIEEITNIDLVNKPELDSEDSLQHYGILGMHWGIRRYQNADGSLTDLGRRRMAKVLTRRERKISRRVERAQRKEQRKRDAILKDPEKLRRNLDKFSNDEIDAAYKRMEWDKKLSDISVSRLKQGKNYVDTALSYGETLNKAINFINSNAGKAIRQKIGMSTDDWMKFNSDKDDKKKD